MKTVFRIFGILAILFSLLTCGMSIYRAGLDKDDLVENKTQLAEAKTQLASLKEQVKVMTGESKVEMDKQIAEIEDGMNSIPSESTYLILQIFLAVLLVLALTFGVLLFRPNTKLVTQLLAAAVIVFLVTYFVSPDLKRGEYSGLPSRTLALLSGIPVVLAGFFALMVAKKNAVK